MPKQKSRQFDVVTLQKIGKGALIAATGAAAIALLQFLGSADLQEVCTQKSMWFCDQFLLPFVAWSVPFGINLVREWMKGE